MLSLFFLAAWLGLSFGDPFSSSPAWAVAGAKLMVAGEFALVRKDPHGAASVVARLPAGQSVIEIVRQQNWVQIGVVGKGITGWIHHSFLTKGTDAGARPEPLIPPMRRFRPAFETFNATKRARSGAPPFTSLHQPSSGVLLVDASIAWWRSPPIRRRSDLASLFQMWKVANDQLPVVVFVRHPNGEQQMRQGDEGTPSDQP